MRRTPTRFDARFDDMDREAKEAKIFREEVPDVEVDESVLIPSPAFGLLLINPKTAFNVATCVRSASCFQCPRVWITGDRIDLEGEKFKLPREERMKGYKHVELQRQSGDCLRNLPSGITPVAVEVRDAAVPLPDFAHPENALYVFGPEDGHLDRGILLQCHEFVVIPARHCFNLGVAASIVLYDRMMKAMHVDLE